MAGTVQVTQVGQVPPAWYDLIAQFKQYAQQFENARNDLLAQAGAVANMDPQTQSDYQDMLQKASDTESKVVSIRNGIDDIQNAIAGAWDKVTGAAQSLWGTITQGGTLDTQTGFDQPMAELGFLPVLIPIAAVTVSVAAIAYFLNDYAQFSQRLTAMKQLQSQGYTAAQAASVVAKVVPSNGGILSNVKDIGVIAALGVGAFFLYHMFGSGKR